MTAATESLLGRDLLVPLGGIAGLLALAGMALLLPILLSQRREIGRLMGDAAWDGPEAKALITAMIGG